MRSRPGSSPSGPASTSCFQTRNRLASRSTHAALSGYDRRPDAARDAHDNAEAGQRHRHPALAQPGRAGEGARERRRRLERAADRRSRSRLRRSRVRGRGSAVGKPRRAHGRVHPRASRTLDDEPAAPPRAVRVVRRHRRPPRPVQRLGPPLVVGGEGRVPLGGRTPQATAGGIGSPRSSDHPTVSRRPATPRCRTRATNRARTSRRSLFTPSPPINRDTIEQFQQLGVERLVFLPQPRRRPRWIDTALCGSSRSSETSTRLKKSSAPL